MRSCVESTNQYWEFEGSLQNSKKAYRIQAEVSRSKRAFKRTAVPLQVKNQKYECLKREVPYHATVSIPNGQIGVGHH